MSHAISGKPELGQGHLLLQVLSWTSSKTIINMIWRINDAPAFVGSTVIVFLAVLGALQLTKTLFSVARGMAMQQLLSIQKIAGLGRIRHVKRNPLIRIAMFDVPLG